MGIDVALVNERHEPKQAVFDPGQLLTRLATGQWFRMQSSVCLQFVDPCGDTVFNQAQIPQLLSELEESALDLTEPAALEHIEKVCNLVRQARGLTHMYIKFIGD